MNQTIANEIVLKVAEQQLAGRWECWIQHDGGCYNLRVAIRKVKPRIERMRKRLDAARAKRVKRNQPFAGPAWLKKAIDSMP